MRLVDVRAHSYRDRRIANWASEVAGRWTIEDLRADPGYCHDWISFDCLAWSAPHTLYPGLAAIDCDIIQHFDPTSGAVVDLGQPYPGRRLFAYDPSSRRLDDLGRLLDPDINDGPTRVHMLVPGDDGVLYTGENDNTLRSSYLWECHVAS